MDPCRLREEGKLMQFTGRTSISLPVHPISQKGQKQLAGMHCKLAGIMRPAAKRPTYHELGYQTEMLQEG